MKQLLFAPALFSILAAGVVSAQDAVLVPIQGPIDRYQTVLVQRGLDRAVDTGAEYLILEIDTFGGRLDAALEIAGALSSAEDITTVAFVDSSPQQRGVSWSAGALISLACNRIYMAPGTSIGAATPVVQGGQQGQRQAGEKTVSAVRGQMAAFAERNGHPPAVARAMVDSAYAVVAIEIDGEERVVSPDEAQRLSETSDVEVRRIEQLSREGELLTLTAGQMERYGISDGSPTSRTELADRLEVAAIEELEITGGDRVLTVLSGSGFTTLLVLCGLIALWLELTSPGFGIPGAIALTAFATLFAVNIMVGRAGAPEILLFVLGIALLIFEIFVIPGFGVAGISGLGALALSLILALQRFVVPETAYEWDVFGRNALIVGGSVVFAVLGALLAAMILKNTRMFSRLSLATTQETSAGYVAQEESETVRYLHSEGVAETTLRPSGKVRLDSETVTAESEGTFIDKGSRVKVVRVDGNRLVVREV